MFPLACLINSNPLCGLTTTKSPFYNHRFSFSNTSGVRVYNMFCLVSELLRVENFQEEEEMRREEVRDTWRPRRTWLASLKMDGLHRASEKMALKSWETPVLSYDKEMRVSPNGLKKLNGVSDTNELRSRLSIRQKPKEPTPWFSPCVAMSRGISNTHLSFWPIHL